MGYSATPFRTAVRAPIATFGMPSPVTLASDDYVRLIAALVELRKARGVSQTALADMLGKPQSFIAKIERRERRLDLLEFCQLSRALGLAPEVALTQMLSVAHL